MTNSNHTLIDSNSSALNDLIEQASHGDEAAVAKLLADFSGVISRELRTQRRFYSLKSLVDADDIQQSVWRCFFNALTHGDVAFRDSRDVAAYLTKVTQNRIESQFRKQLAGKRDVRRTLNTVDFDVADQHVKQPSQQLSTLEFLKSVMQLMTPEERLISKRRADGATWEELAVEMGTTAEAMRKRHARTAARVVSELEAEN